MVGAVSFFLSLAACSSRSLIFFEQLGFVYWRLHFVVVSCGMVVYGDSEF